MYKTKSCTRKNKGHQGIIAPKVHLPLPTTGSGKRCFGYTNPTLTSVAYLKILGNVKIYFQPEYF
jgi:hypothetical protein